MPVALIAGVTGIVGNNLAHQLLANGWQVHGLARRPPPTSPASTSSPPTCWTPPRCAPPSRREAHACLHHHLAPPAHRGGEHPRQRRHGAQPPRRLSHGSTVQHVALVTGLKHYLGPFEAYGKGALPATPFREEQPRLDVENFYYAQEDEVFAAAARDGFAGASTAPTPSSATPSATP